MKKKERERERERETGGGGGGGGGGGWGNFYDRDHKIRYVFLVRVSWAVRLKMGI